MTKTNKKTDTMKAIEKDELIKKEIALIKSLIKDVDKKKVKGLNSLIENVAFMAYTLKELRGIINREGLICEYQNGENQKGTKRSPYVEIYNNMIKNYITGMSKILEQSSKGNITIDDGFEAFLNGKSKN